MTNERSEGERLGDLIREARASATGWDEQEAYVWPLVQTDASLVFYAAREFVKNQLRTASSTSRSTVTKTAPAPGEGQPSKKMGALLLATSASAWQRWDRYELAGGIKLSEATRADLEASIAWRMSDMRTRSKNLKLEQWILARLPDEETPVAAVWTEAELDEISRQADIAADTYMGGLTDLDAAI